MTPADPSDYEAQDLEALGSLRHYQSWILRWLAPVLRGRVLEVGAGSGAIAQHYVDLVGEAVLVEPAAKLAAGLRERFGDRPQVSIHPGTLESLQRPAGSFDGAVMVNVLEHIDDDLGALQALGTLLRPGGALGIFVPAVPALYGSLDARVGHVRRYDRARLARIVTTAGFTLETLRWLDLGGVLPWYIVGRVLRPDHFSTGLARLYDRACVPLLRALEERIDPPIGKNLVCLARKPG